MVFSALQVTFPIIPIIVSCIISTVAIIFSNKATKTSKAVTMRKKKATVTIIVVTVVYIICNIPAVLNYTRYIVAVYITGRDFLAGDSSSEFLRKYIWLLAFVIMVALNSLANPIVYFLRMKDFRSELPWLKAFTSQTDDQGSNPTQLVPIQGGIPKYGANSRGFNKSFKSDTKA